MTKRSIADFEPLSSAEEQLVKSCLEGRRCTLGAGKKKGKLPPEGGPTSDRAVRAELLRLLVTGGPPDDALHDSGVWLEGAHITGRLNLRHARGRGQCVLE